MMTITVSRSVILRNRQTGKDDPAWVLIDERDNSTQRVAYADFGSFRLIQRPVKPDGSVCFIETTATPLSVSEQIPTVVK